MLLMYKCGRNQYNSEWHTRPTVPDGRTVQSTWILASSVYFIRGFLWRKLRGRIVALKDTGPGLIEKREGVPRGRQDC